MSKIAQQAANLIDLLPDNDKTFAYEFIKKLVLAYDPDFTKVTEAEYNAIIEGEKEMESGEFVNHNNIDW